MNSLPLHQREARDHSAANAVHSIGMEGGSVGPEQRELFAAWSRGDLSDEELRAKTDDLVQRMLGAQRRSDGATG